MRNPVVVLDTTKGTIKIELFSAEAPKTAQNFHDLVTRGFYNDKTFHRYEPGFVIQGGCPKGNGTGGFTDPATGKERRIQLEVTRAEARQSRHGGNGSFNEPDSASCQFYITLDKASFLDQKYAVFGKVIEGLDVVQQLRAGDKMTKVYELAAAKS